ncbi:hypothetical protein F5B19DRAFT_500684 [Rostrohypoxylon terebratum]|nr:hypothetical protein F5B19DRAFT_500684 [Rostrohypoxylon terebratum]
MSPYIHRPLLVTNTSIDEHDVGYDKLLRRELWQPSSLGALAIAVPPGSKINSAEISSTAGHSLVRETQGTSCSNGDENQTDNQRSVAGLPTASKISRYMDTYPISGLIVKKRYVSPTHWLFCSTLSPHALDWLDEQVKSQGIIWQDMVTCKLLGRSIKTARILPWTQGQYGRHLPTKSLADELFDAYLRTFESVYRILHVPASKRAYDALWENPSLASSAHVVQLQLCLAIGACIYDDVFTLRPQAQQWIREAEHWLIPSGKVRATVFDFQTMCLLQLARQTSQHLPENQVWASSGALIRAAMSAGLHRDPTRLLAMPPLEVEIRRRLWTTIIELALDSSIDAGGPPMLSPDDFDCLLPLNLNDEDLDLDGDDKFLPHSPNEYTDTSIQIALGRTQAVRLSIAKYVNCIKVNHSYPETLKLSTGFMNDYRSLVKYLYSLRPRPTKFQQQYCEFVMTRYIFALHVYYMPRALKDPGLFYTSRTLCVDTALRFVTFLLPLPSSFQEPFLATLHRIVPFEEHCSDFVRLFLCGGGPFRSIPWKSFMVIAADLATMLRQAHDTSPWMSVVPFNQTQSGSRARSIETITLLREAAKLTKTRMYAGHHNVKDLIWVNVNLAGIEAAMKGIPAEQAMDTRGKEVLADAIRILGELAGTSTVSWDDHPSLGNERLLAASEFWSMGFADIDWDTNVGC